MPLLDLFWTMFYLFCWVLWFMLLFRVYGDLFSRDDIGGWAKAGWTVFTLFLPFLGVFVYLIAQGRGMAERAAVRLYGYQPSTRAHVQPASGGASADQRAAARDLLDSGAITAAEYQRMVPSAHH